MRSVPTLNEFHAWLKKQEAAALPKSALGKAVRYCLNQWERLTAFLKDGRREIHNNRTERSIKPVVIGWKNWLFANTSRGALSSAVIYSIIETAKVPRRSWLLMASSHCRTEEDRFPTSPL
ncbi:MAG: transposase, partial [Firmicutes bacterium]|nr:transposase [Bacillota bacterium]